MNNKGFTLIELLATIVVLAIVAGITFGIINADFGKTKEKTEEVFVDTIRDAMDMYLASNAKELKFNNKCTNKINKKHGNVDVYKVDTNFKSVIESYYHPITQADLINPANKNVSCNNAGNISISIYRDNDYVYYYSINKNEFGCLLNTSGEYSDVISNLPEGFDCEYDDNFNSIIFNN